MDNKLLRWWNQDECADLGDEALRALTHEYWRLDGSLETRLHWYTDNLLAVELRCAEQRCALTFPPCHTLVFLVGHSIEPLFQTLSVFQPARLVLLLNQQYDVRGMAEPQTGTQWGEEIARLVDSLLASKLARPFDVELREVSDAPDAVFQVLCDHVLADRQAGHDVIVDITGAKKSIAAGAFLFAAYADIPISYVDFDEYDDVMRRPLGYMCRIGTLTNPYDAFRLREWERVRRLYENYHFRAAAETLEGVVHRAGAAFSSLRPADKDASERLLALLRFYEAWDDGDYPGAALALRALLEGMPGFAPPMAVTLLGDVWPRADDDVGAQEAALQLLDLHEGLRDRHRSIFQSNDLLLAYARDELAKIDRLVGGNEDNRSALLRAAGLDELLLKARLVRLWHTGRIGLWDQDEDYQGDSRSFHSGGLGQKLYRELLRHQGTDHMRNALLQGGVSDRRLGREVPAFVRIDVWRDSYRARPAGQAPRLADYTRDCGLSGETLTHLRNQAIHMYLYVTDAIAGSAVAIARANLAEFERTWAPLAGPVPATSQADVESLPWDEVCRLCGVGFLPLASQPRFEYI